MAFAMIVEFTGIDTPEKKAELHRELLALVGPTRKEAGCLCYDLHVDENDDSLFFFYERWASKEAHAAHDKTAHVTHIKAVLPNLTTGVRMLFLKHVEP